MSHMGKLINYIIVLMSYLVTEIALIYSVNSLSNAIKMPLPAVKKVLKILSSSGLLKSERGTQGSYKLNLNSTKIYMTAIITTAKDPMLLTVYDSSDNHCEQKYYYLIKSNFTRINTAILLVLDEVKLSDMMLPKGNIKTTYSIKFYPSAQQMRLSTAQDGKHHV
ncbi:MAG: Rrf2 family transcriptional regulator [Piscirickettsiaceae bacterium]|nr:Rrf2 family transcriptional regulator [Piscirickettsiaceae bacterium]